MIEYARLITKSSEGLPTIPPSASHDNGDWSSNDIYEHELYLDSITGYFYTRKGDEIVRITTTSLDFVPYRGATADLDLGAFDLYTNKVWLYDEPNDGYGSIHLTDGVFHVEDVSGHSMITFEDGFFTFANGPTTRALLNVTGLTANRDYVLPNVSGTLALTSDIPSLAGYVPTSRTITINGTTQDLSANRSWTIALATPTLDQVTTAGNTTANPVTIGALTINASITASGAIARGSYFNNTLIAAANNDVLVGLDILNTFTNGSFTGVANYNIRTTGLITKQYFRSPTTNQGNHTIAFGFGGAGEQVKFIASAAGSSGRGNLYVASVSGDTAVATTANANVLFAHDSTTFYKFFGIDQSALTSGHGITLSGNQNAAVTNGIYFKYSETRVAILVKPHGGGGYADFRIAIVPVGGANNPPQESDTKFMITKDTTNVLINTTVDAGFKTDINGTARVVGLFTGTGGATISGSNTTISTSKTFINNISMTTSGFGDTGYGMAIDGGIRWGVNAGNSYKFGHWAGLKGAFNWNNASASVIEVGLGATTPNVNNITWTSLNITPTFNADFSGRSGNIIRGIYYNPTITSLVNGIRNQLRAFESSFGGAYFNTTAVDGSAILQADSITQGFLPPRMTTTQINAIASPADGLQVYNTTISHMCVYQAGTWVKINHSPM